MSQKASRKAVVTDEKEKRQTHSPVKDMKKKMAANAEKEKQVAEKSTEKPAEKTDKPAEKEKPVEKKSEKTDKKAEPVAEKKEENNKEEKGRERKSAGETGKPDKQPKQNGAGAARVNGSGAANGDAGSAPDDEDADEMDDDEAFPELAYDSSDPEFEPDAPPRSLTRRSQAKVTRTPETPRPASDKQDPAAEDSKESKVLKLKEDVPSTDRKLRSADSPKPEAKKPESDKKSQETQPAEQAKKAEETPAKGTEGKEKEKGEKENAEGKSNSEVVVVIDLEEHEEEPRKTDTNFSKSRVKVSPYRRSTRLADQTASSVMANYTGNNTTMEMDITETSSFISEDQSLDDSSYLNGLRSIRGRRSYKPLKEIALKHVANKAARANVSGSASEQPSRPTGTVVGRKRKPEPEASIELGTEASEADLLNSHGKRMRLLDRLFRRSERAAEIVGINTDLPLTAPVASAETFDPESLKNVATPEPEQPVPLAHSEAERDSKRCVVM